MEPPESRKGWPDDDRLHYERLLAGIVSTEKRGTPKSATIGIVTEGKHHPLAAGDARLVAASFKRAAHVLADRFFDHQDVGLPEGDSGRGNGALPDAQLTLVADCLHLFVRVRPHPHALYALRATAFGLAAPSARLVPDLSRSRVPKRNQEKQTQSFEAYNALVVILATAVR